MVEPLTDAEPFTDAEIALFHRKPPNGWTVGDARFLATIAARDREIAESVAVMSAACKTIDAHEATIARLTEERDRAAERMRERCAAVADEDGTAHERQSATAWASGRRIAKKIRALPTDWDGGAR